MVWDVKRKKREKKIKGLLKKAGVAPAPKNAENEMYSGKWDTVKSFDLSEEPPQKLNFGKEDVGKLFWLVYWRDIRVIKKKVEAKKKLSPEEVEQKEKNKRKRQLNAMQKEMATQRGDFIKLVIEKKLVPEKPDYDSINSRLLMVMFRCGCWMNVNTAYGFLSGKKETWSLSEKETERLDKEFAALPLHQQLFIYANNAVSDNNMFEWNASYYKKHGEILMAFEEVLKEFGFSYTDEEFNKISNGTHNLYFRNNREGE